MSKSANVFFTILVLAKERHVRTIVTDRQTDRQTHRQKDRQTYRETGKTIAISEAADLPNYLSTFLLRSYKLIKQIW